MQEIDSRVSEAMAQFRETNRRRIGEARQRLLEEANFGLRVDLGPNDLEGEQGAWRGELEGVIRDAFPRGRDGEIDPCLGPLEGWFSRVRVDVESVEGYLIKINAWAAQTFAGPWHIEPRGEASSRRKRPLVWKTRLACWHAG